MDAIEMLMSTPSDLENINLQHAHEVRYWTGLFDVSEVQLVVAVRAVGTATARVRDYLLQNAIHHP